MGWWDFGGMPPFATLLVVAEQILAGWIVGLIAGMTSVDPGRPALVIAATLRKECRLSASRPMGSASGSGL
jgi:hypothetical protein